MKTIDNTENLNARLARVLGQIETTPEHRYRLHAKLSSVLDDMAHAGLQVAPAHLRLRDALREDAVEAMFDNVPL